MDIAEDQKATQTLVDAFGELLDRPTSRLSSQRIDASFLQGLLNPDPVEAVLQWLDDPQGFQARRDKASWSAFVEQCKRDLGLDSVADGELTAGRKLCERHGDWQQIWARCERDPAAYPGVEARLRASKPQELFAGAPGAWPQDNDDPEADLRRALQQLADVTPSAARKRLAALWEEHAPQRRSVWAQLGQAPLAFALEHLHNLAEGAAGSPPEVLGDLIEAYPEYGGRVDAAFLQSLAEVSAGTDRAAVEGARLAVYRPWLETQALALQQAFGPNASHYTPGAIVVRSPAW